MTVRYIQARDLLSLAEDLAGRDAGRGRPRSISLRRAISSAYYAVFHQVSQHAAEHLIGDPTWSPGHAAVARWITHTDLATLSKAVNGHANPALGEVIGAPSPQLRDLARDFVDLQDARHGSDYDDYFEVSRQSALDYVDIARRSVEGAVSLMVDRDSSYRRFLALCVGGVKVARRR